MSTTEPQAVGRDLWTGQDADSTWIDSHSGSNAKGNDPPSSFLLTLPEKVNSI